MGKKTIQDIARILVEKNAMDASSSEQFVTTMFSVIQQALEQGQQVKVRGLGTFKIIDVDARESVNVNTGERVLIAGHGKVSFTPDTTMRELVNKPFSQFETVVLNEGVEFEDTETPAEDVEAPTEDIETPAENVEIPTKETREPTEEAEVPVGIKALVEELETPATGADAAADEEITELPEVERLAQEETPAEETPVEEVPAEEPVAEEVPTEELIVKEAPVEEPIVEDTPTEEPVEEKTPAVETLSDLSKQYREEIPDDDEEESSSWRWVLGVLGVLLLMAVCAAGGYYFGYGQGLEKGMTVVKEANDSLSVVAATDSVATEQNDSLAAKQDSISQTETPVEAVQKPENTPAPAEAKTEAPAQPKQEIPAKPKAETPATPKTETPTPEQDQYAAKDVRVRYGGYRIVGLDHTEKIRPGDTSSRIARRTLGEGMECYIEVYNGWGANPQLKEGQTVKIPKVVLKKKKRQ